MISPALLVFCSVLAALIVFQGLLVAGVPLGHYAWGGQHRVLPMRLRIGSLISIALYMLFMLVLSDRSGFLALAARRVLACCYLDTGGVSRAWHSDERHLT